MPRILKRSGRNSHNNNDNDDSSVDSKGNIRGLIDYDYDSDDSSDGDVIMAEPGITLYKQGSPAAKRAKYHRAAKDKANKNIKKAIKNMENSSASPNSGVTITYTINDEKKKRHLRDDEIFDEEPSDDDEDLELLLL